MRNEHFNPAYMNKVLDGKMCIVQHNIFSFQAEGWSLRASDCPQGMPMDYEHMLAVAKRHSWCMLHFPKVQMGHFADSSLLGQCPVQAMNLTC